MTIRRCVLLSIAALMFTMLVGSCALRARDRLPSTDLVGVYRCEGIDADGRTAYTGFVHVKQRGAVYDVLWTNDAGQPTGIGLGLFTGNVLSVVFASGNSVSVASYAIDKDSTLNGRWVSGDGVTSPERWTRVPAGHVPTPLPTQHPQVQDPRVRI